MTEADKRSLEVHVANLRRKIGPAERIETVRGVGYRLASTTT
ncbi:winged helix-turn-helix domain-containing protein [Cryobacterium sp. TMT1-3]|nr:winged helix-turn-helix domain-containing protein [Cryobacterium sp. TMT1-3]